MKLRRTTTCALLAVIICTGSCRPNTVSSSTVVKRELARTDAESRQMGILGFTALGAMMFPILVSLGMASFVSHLPTVFKELASEFGIPSTPPRKFFLFRQKRYTHGGPQWIERLNDLVIDVQRALEGTDAAFQ